MTPIIYHLTLDLKRDLHQVLVMKEGDSDTRTVKITITDNGKEFPIESRITSLKWKKPDQHTVMIDNCTEPDGASVSFTCTDQMLVVPGIVQAELSMNDKDGSQLSTMPFQVSIKPAAVKESDLISSDEFQSLTRLLEEFKKDKAETEEARDLAKSYAHGQTGKREGEDTDNANYYREQAGISSDNAKKHADHAQASANSAAASASSAAESKAQAIQKASEAGASAALASTKAAESADSATLSKSYAMGGTGKRTDENTDNSKYYYEQSKLISESFTGALRPMGTISFANLPAPSNAENGDMYNISDQFTTTSSFEEGAGNLIPAGSNVYKTANGKWDILAGSPVTGVKGNEESSYRKGDVNISPENIGAVSTTYMNEHFAADYVSTSRGTASAKGWYRIAKSERRDADNSCVIILKRGYYSPSTEYQKIQFLTSFRTKKFVSLAAFSNAHMWTNIRHTLDTENSVEYIEIYQDRESHANPWLISIEEALSPYMVGPSWVALTPTLVPDTAEDVTVYAELNLPANFDTGDLLAKNESISCVGRNKYLAYPEGGNLDSGVSSLTGYLKITLPVTWSQTMLGFTVTVYDYLTHSSVDYHIFGYNYVQSTGWINPTAVCVGRADGRHSNLTVRFGHDDSKCAITIGEANTAWSYPKVQVHDVLMGSSGNFSQWKSGWNVAVSSAGLSTITASVANTHVAYGGTASRVSAGPGTANADRHVWFSSNSQEMERDFNDGFMFNPYTKTLTVQNLQGNAASATKAINADKLDGKQASDFALYQVVSSGDFNNMTTPGLYAMRSTTANAPTSGSYHSLIVLHSDTGTYVQQIAIKEGTTNIYIRYGSSSSWGAWKQIYVDGDSVTKSNIVNLIYPVGSIYMSVSSTSPATLFGGNWTRWGNGRVPVSIDTNNTNFNTVEKTGGASTHTLSANQIPEHTHLIPALNGTTVNSGYHKHNLKYDTTCPTSGSATRINGGGTLTSGGAVEYAGDHVHSFTIPERLSNPNSPSGYAHNNLQPYITCYMWKRTA